MPATGTATTRADPATATETSSRSLALSRLVGGAALALLAGACGSANPHPTGGGFSWLVPRTAPAGWGTARIPSGSQIPYPPGWHRLRGDPGTATAVRLGRSGSYLGYLNLTPRQGPETLANWSSFRVSHNREEGDRTVHRLAAARDLRFLSGRGSCVQDAYVTQTDARYIEIACLFVGPHAATVVVGAAPPGQWNDTSPTIERAIQGVRT